MEQHSTPPEDRDERQRQEGKVVPANPSRRPFELVVSSTAAIFIGGVVITGVVIVALILLGIIAG